MLTEVNNSYMNYYTRRNDNFSESNKITNRFEEQSERIRKKCEERSSFTSVKDYKNYLMNKYACLKSSNFSVSIESSLLSKAMKDEKIAQWLEYNLTIMPQVDEKIKSTVEARGSKVVSCHTTINGYDSMTCELVTQSDADPGTEKARKALEERIKKIREEKKLSDLLGHLGTETVVGVDIKV